MNMKVGFHDMKIGLYSGFKTQRSEGHNVFSSGLRAVRNAHHNGKEFAKINSDLRGIKDLLDVAKEKDKLHEIELTVNLIKEAKHKMTEAKIKLNAQHLPKSAQDKALDQLQQYKKTSTQIKKYGEIGLWESVKNFSEAFIDGPNSEQNSKNLFSKMNVCMENSLAIRTTFLRNTDNYLAKDIGGIIKSDHALEDIERLINADNALNDKQFNELGSGALNYLKSIGPKISAEDMIRIMDLVVTSDVTDVDQINREKLVDDLKTFIEPWKSTLNESQSLVIGKLCALFKAAEIIKNEVSSYSTFGFQLGSMLQQSSGGSLTLYNTTHPEKPLVDKNSTKPAHPLNVIQGALGQALMDSFAPTRQ
ncbi:hypothetical protein [Citrobacter sp. Igbk 16]|uniref:hypothetical protein n=1 Tax=Citrobacter sp. Igbk 16 TaxID=2963958 RepID=UPI0023027377|nr:hypothetical protein [Citrobacter sp. Igbk 16]MDA8518179.1 hypothetical protein [Citrobacter sp. Igbk 16]